MPGAPAHLAASNDCQPSFFADIDRVGYLDGLREICLRENYAVHAYALMTNHVHLLMTPSTRGQVARVMQSLVRRYVRYVDDRYRRTGTLWEGRHNGCLVDSDAYLLRCCRYIELNPVRTRTVANPADYRWSSFARNALAMDDPSIRPHLPCLSFGSNVTERCAAYHALVVQAMTPDELEGLRLHLQRQRVYATCHPLLLQNDQGAAVRTLQTQLSGLGYTDAHGHALQPDSDFGPNTRFAVEAFQRDHQLTVDGKVGTNTRQALGEAVQARARPSLDSPEHAGNQLYREAMDAVRELDRNMGRTPDKQNAQMAGVLATAAQKEGLQHINEVVLSTDGSRAFAVQAGAVSKLAHVQTAEAVNTTLTQSAETWSQQAQQAEKQVGAPAPDQTPAHTAAPMAL